MNASVGQNRVWTIVFLLVVYAAQVALWILLLFYVPALARSLSDTGTALPGFTRWVLNGSEFVRRNYFIVAPASLLVYVGLGLLVGYRGRASWVRILLGVTAALSLLHLTGVFLSAQLPNVKVP